MVTIGFIGLFSTMNLQVGFGFMRLLNRFTISRVRRGTVESSGFGGSGVWSLEFGGVSGMKTLIS